jgi:hypothetical protein
MLNGCKKIMINGNLAETLHFDEIGICVGSEHACCVGSNSGCVISVFGCVCKRQRYAGQRLYTGIGFERLRHWLQRHNKQR